MSLNLKILVLICTSFSLFQTTFGQTYIRPEYGGRSIKEIEILKITITEKYTIVECIHTNEFKLGWAAAMPTTFIRVSGSLKKYQLVKTSRIPIFPKKHHYHRAGEQLRYKLYFPPISPSVKYLDIIEIEGSDKAFNFYKVKLKPIA